MAGALHPPKARSSRPRSGLGMPPLLDEIVVDHSSADFAALAMLASFLGTEKNPPSLNCRFSKTTLQASALNCPVMPPTPAATKPQGASPCSRSE